MTAAEPSNPVRGIIRFIRQKSVPVHYTEAPGSSARMSYQDMADLADRLEAAVQQMENAFKLELDRVAGERSGAGKEEEEKKDGPVRLERSHCALLSLVADAPIYDRIASGEQREYYMEPEMGLRTLLKAWDDCVSSTAAPVVEFQRGCGEDAPRIAFWCFCVDTYSGMACYAYTEGQRHPEWGEPKEPHFLIQLGGPVEILEGGAK